MEKTEFSFAVHRERLSERVASHIQERISNGVLKAGDRLPTEAQLCDQFQVSRTVIREAMTVLAGRGLITIEPGRGTFVSTLTPQKVSEYLDLYVRASDLSLRNVFEIRELLEVRIAELAAQRATRMDHATMRDTIKRMDGLLGSDAEFLAVDHEFHMALAAATHNEFFVALAAPLAKHTTNLRLLGGKISTANEVSQIAHKQVLEGVVRGDSEAAGEAMRQHLREVLHRVQLALAQEEGP